MVFNLIPIPPLDGSKVLMAVLPERYYFSYMRFEQFGMIFLLLLITFGAFDGFLVGARSSVISGMLQIVNKILGLA
jgi:Zn-dependent protease